MRIRTLNGTVFQLFTASPPAIVMGVALVLALSSIVIHDAYGCSRDGSLDYVLPWKYIFQNNCESQLTVSWPGVLVWIILGFLLYNFVRVLAGKEAIWHKNKKHKQSF